MFNIRQRFCKTGSIEDTIFHKPLSGRPTLIGEAIDAHMTRIACSTPPEGRSQWTIRLIKDRLVTLKIVEEFSHMTIARGLKKRNQALVEPRMENSTKRG